MIFEVEGVMREVLPDHTIESLFGDVFKDARKKKKKKEKIKPFDFNSIKEPTEQELEKLVQMYVELEDFDCADKIREKIKKIKTQTLEN